MLPVWPITFFLAIAYFLTGYAGLMLPAAGSHITLVWLPTGIAVAAFYRWGIGCWPAVSIGALAVNMAIGTSLPLALGIAVGNTLGPLFTAGILLRAGFQSDLKRSRDILLLTGAAMVGMLVTASLGVSSLKLAGQLSNGPFSAWLIWWAGDVTGVVTAAPLILVISRSELRNLWTRRSEFLGMVASITLSIAVVFFINGANGPALAIAFVPYPLVAWAAIRFGPIGTSLAVILLSFGAAAGTSSGLGPFYRSAPTDSLSTLSLFMLTTAAVAWVVSVLSVSKLAAVDTKRILERALEEVSFGVLVADNDRRIIYANGGFSRLTGYSELELIGKSCAILQGPDTDSIACAELKRSLHNTCSFDGEILNYRKDGTTFWNALIITPLVNELGERNGFLGIQRDVTDRKLGQQALLRSEERFRMYVDHAPNGVFVVDSHGRYKDVNPAACRQTGYSREEILSMGTVDLTPPNAVAQSLQAFEKLKLEGSVEYEQSLLCKSGAIRWFALAAARLTNGDFIGFTSDIQGLKETENALRQSRDRFEYLVSSCPAVIYTTKPSGDYATTFMSENVRSLLGFDPDQFLADPGFCAKQIHPDDVGAIYEVLPKLMELGRQRLEFRFRTNTGEYRWLDDEMVLIRDADGKPKEIIGYLVDITDRKRIEEALSKSEEQSRLALDAAELGTWRHLVSQDTLELDQRAQKIMHFERAKLTSEEFAKRIHPDDLPRVEEERLRSAAPGADGSFANEHRILLSDGQVRWIAVRARIIFGFSNGVRVPGYVLGTVQDITDRKRAGETLLENETRLRLALTAANQGLYDLNVQTGECLVSPEYAIMLGYDPSEFRETNSAWRERTHPDDREAAYQVYLDYISGQREEYRVEFRQRTKSGEWKWVLSIGAVVTRTADGQPLRMLGTHTDITKRKQAEAKLQEAERRQRLALDAARMGTWEWEIGSGDLVWDDRQQILFGFEPRTFDGRVETFLNLIHPDDLHSVRQIFAHAEGGKDFDDEFRIRLPSGEVRWMHGSGIAVPKSDHGAPRLVGINYDITERKRAEETVQRILDGIAPRTGREFFRVLVDYLCNVCEVEYAFVGAIDPDNQASVRTIAVSHRGVATDNFTYDLRATPCEQVVGQSLCSHPSGVQQAFPDDTLLVEMGIEGYLGAPLWFSNGQALGLIVLLHNRPLPNPEQAEVVLRVVAARAGAELERQQADAALQESEERLRIFVENAPAGVAMFDRELRYLSYSRRWLTDYGLGEQNLIGRSHYEVFPDIPDRWKEIHTRCLTGIPERCEQDRFVRSDGTADYVRWEIQPWTDATGAIGGLVFFTESITDQVNSQEQLRTSLREKESMLKEIHHRVKNNLQVISSLLSLQAANVTQPDACSVLAESQNRVRAMALVHETLYQSRDLADVDLSLYLGELCGHLFRSYGVDSSRVLLDLDVEALNISLDRTIPCGLLVNEVVSNSLKHAFPGNRSGKITVRAGTEQDGWLRLILADDGVGLPADLVIEKTPTLGLNLVQILSEQLGAKLSLNRTEGTQFEILFPQ